MVACTSHVGRRGVRGLEWQFLLLCVKAAVWASRGVLGEDVHSSLATRGVADRFLSSSGVFFPAAPCLQKAVLLGFSGVSTRSQPQREVFVFCLMKLMI